MLGYDILILLCHGLRIMTCLHTHKASSRDIDRPQPVWTKGNDPGTRKRIHDLDSLELAVCCQAAWSLCPSQRQGSEAYSRQRDGSGISPCVETDQV